MALTCTVDKYYEVHQAGDDHVVFQLTVKDDQESFLVWKRYTQFVELHAQLCREFRDVPPTPRKRMFGKMFGSTGGSKFLEGRRVELNSWMQDILAIPGVSKTQAVDAFLTHEKNKPPEGIDNVESIVTPSAPKTVNFEKEESNKGEPPSTEDSSNVARTSESRDASRKARRSAPLVRNSGSNQGDSFTNAMMRAMCQIHPHQPLSLYCVETKEMVCASCVVMQEHRNHTMQEIPDSSSAKYNELSEKIQQLHEREQILQDSLDRIQKLQNNLSEQAETKEGNIRVTMKAVREFIDEKEDELISATMEKELSITLMLQKQRSNRWALSRYFSRLIKAVNDAADEEDSIKFLQRWGVSGGSKLENEMDTAINNYVIEQPVANAVIPEWLLVNENHMPNFLESEIRRLHFEEKYEGGASSELPIRYEQFEAASKLQEKRDQLMQRLHMAQSRMAAIEKETQDRKRSISTLTNAVSVAEQKAREAAQKEIEAAKEPEVMQPVAAAVLATPVQALEAERISEIKLEGAVQQGSENGGAD